MTILRTIVDWRPYVGGLFHWIVAPFYFKRFGAGGRVAGRQHFYRPLMKISVGKRAMLGREIFWQVAKDAEVSLGDDTSVNSNCLLVASAGISIGDNVAIGEFVSIRDQEHKFSPESGVRGQGFMTAPIVIEKNCWIGRGVYIGPGSHIRSGSIVAANSVVRGDFPQNSLLAGAPAVVKKTLT